MKSPSRRRGAGLLGAVAAVALLAGACVPPPPPPPTVLLYGDSLLHQSEPYVVSRIQGARPGWRVVTRSWGGTALCDWVGHMQADGNLNAKVVVIEFSGNNLTPCMGSNTIPAGDPQWLALYRSSAQQAAAIWAARGVRVLFVSTPRGVCSTPPHPLDAVYSSVAAQWGASFSTAPSDALTIRTTPPPDLTTTTSTSTTSTSTTSTSTTSTSTTSTTSPPKDTAIGSASLAAMAEPMVQAASSWPCTGLGDPPPASVYAFEMPCRPDEGAAHGCQGGQIAVRDGTPGSPGGHFACTVPNVSPCPGYSSGVRRFGDAIVAATIPLMT